MRRSSLLVWVGLVAMAPVWAQAPAAKAVPSEIEVDRSCRIVTMDLRDPVHPRVRRRYDGGICHLESVFDSTHPETTIRNGVTKHALVEVREREYVMQNPYPQAITFTVKQSVPKSFRIDSDPAPAEFANNVATFHVTAQPGQTVRLHVGERD